MSTALTTTLDPAPSATRRPPATVVGAAAASVLAAAVGAYGSVYFTGLQGWTGMNQTYVVTYAATSLFGLVSAIALLFGRDLTGSAGRRGVLCYAIWLVGFSLFKMFRFQEWEAATFLVVGLLIVLLSVSPSTRRWAR
jgi:hypothetical protein